MPFHNTPKALGVISWLLLSLVMAYLQENPLNAFFIAAVITGFFLALLFSVLPDVDTKKSRIFESARLAIAFLASLALSIAYFFLFTPGREWNDAVRIAFSLFAPSFAIAFILLGRMPLEHRKQVHTLRFGFLASVLVALLFNAAYSFAGLAQEDVLLYSLLAGAYCMASFATHLAADGHWRV